MSAALKSQDAGEDRTSLGDSGCLRPLQGELLPDFYSHQIPLRFPFTCR